MNDYPCNFVYHHSSQTLTWDSALPAQEYEVWFEPYPMGVWNRVYWGGTNTVCPFNMSMGAYLIKGRRRKDNIWMEYGPDEQISVT